MTRKISEVRHCKCTGMECRKDDLRMEAFSGDTVLRSTSFRKKLRIIGRVCGKSWEMLEEERTAVLSRSFRKDAFLVEIGEAYLVLAPADSLKDSFYAALIDGRANFHLALCERCPKKDHWAFRSADSGRKLKITNVLVLGEVLAFEEMKPKRSTAALPTEYRPTF